MRINHSKSVMNFQFTSSTPSTSDYTHAHAMKSHQSCLNRWKLFFNQYNLLLCICCRHQINIFFMYHYKTVSGINKIFTFQLSVFIMHIEWEWIWEKFNDINLKCHLIKTKYIYGCFFYHIKERSFPCNCLHL